MKKRLAILLAAVLFLLGAAPVLAAQGNVTYSGNAGEFVFIPGSGYSDTDLFPNFKDVMPGDSLVQPVTVRNDAANGVKVKIYMRSLGAHADSVDFLSQLRLRVEKAADNTMPYMFDAAADATAQLMDWVCLGTLYSGGEVDLNVILDVPAELDNAYQQQIGYLDWQFMVEEYPIEPTDPAVDTGDTARPGLWAGILLLSLFALLLLLWAKRRADKKQ